VHAQLSTKGQSLLGVGLKRVGDPAEKTSTTCRFCSASPGALPVLNAGAGPDCLTPAAGSPIGWPDSSVFSRVFFGSKTTSIGSAEGGRTRSANTICRFRAFPWSARGYIDWTSRRESAVFAGPVEPTSTATARYSDQPASTWTRDRGGKEPPRSTGRIIDSVSISDFVTAPPGTAAHRGISSASPTLRPAAEAAGHPPPLIREIFPDRHRTRAVQLTGSLEQGSFRCEREKRLGPGGAPGGDRASAHPRRGLKNIHCFKSSAMRLHRRRRDVDSRAPEGPGPPRSQGPDAAATNADKGAELTLRDQGETEAGYRYFHEARFARRAPPSSRGRLFFAARTAGASRRCRAPGQPGPQRAGRFFVEQGTVAARPRAARPHLAPGGIARSRRSRPVSRSQRERCLEGSPTSSRRGAPRRVDDRRARRRFPGFTAPPRNRTRSRPSSTRGKNQRTTKPRSSTPRVRRTRDPSAGPPFYGRARQRDSRMSDDVAGARLSPSAREDRGANAEAGR